MFDNIKNNLSSEELLLLPEEIIKFLPDKAEDKDLLDWQKLVIYIIDSNDSLIGYQVLKELKKKIQTDDILIKYEEVLLWLYYSSFPALSESEIQEFFRIRNFLIILQDENYNDLIQKVKFRLSKNPLHTRNNFREKIYNAMHENQNILTKNFIVKGKKSTIANWLKEYDAKIGIEIAESIVLVDFVNKSFNEALLSDEEKILLKRFLDFYEYIKLSSYDPAGFEEDIVITEKGKTYISTEGKLIEVARNFHNTASVSLQEKESYSANEHNNLTIDKTLISDEHTNRDNKSLPAQSNIIAQSQVILASTKASAIKIMDQLNQSIEQKNVLNSLSCILLLSQIRKLDDILLDQRFSKMVLDDLKKNNILNFVESFNINPRAPQYIARFLKIILQNNLNLEPKDAIIFGEKLSRILSIESDKYQNIIKNNKWNV